MPTRTRWWWIRHAPVRSTGGRIYGNSDPVADTDDPPTYAGLARLLPADAFLVTSHLQRTHQTADAIKAAGLALPDAHIEEDLAEQDFGDWQGSSWKDMEEADPDAYFAFWQTPARSAPPGGESFADLIARTAGIIERYTESHAGQDIVAVCHGGTIRAAVAHVLGLTPELGMSFTIDTLSVTRLEHVEGGLLRGKGGAWRVAGINQPSHDRMDGSIR